MEESPLSPSFLFDSPVERAGLVYGRDDTPNLIGFELERTDQIRVFTRTASGIDSTVVPFEPFILLTDEDLLKGWFGDCCVQRLAGRAKFRRLVSFPNLVARDSAMTYLSRKTGGRSSARNSFCLYWNDAVRQYLLMSGRTHFLGMRFADLKRMQIDLETYCDARFEFPNAKRASDRITAIAMSDTTGWERVITARDHDEAGMLTEMAREIRLRDPDVLEGHNFFRFDLTYLRVRAERHGLELKLGRNARVLDGRPARVEFGERRLSFTDYHISGRHVIDTWFLAQHHDLRTGELKGHGLKDVARHFGVSAPGRTYISGEKASWYFDHEPDTLFRYALDDVRETRAVSELLSPIYFFQAKIFPRTLQHVAVEDEVTKMDDLVLREYLAQRQSIPAPMEGEPHALERRQLRSAGLKKNVLRCRADSLHPSIMLADRYLPKSDTLGLVSGLLRLFSGTRAGSGEQVEEQNADTRALKDTYRLLLGSLYTYLGSSAGHFNDFDAERQTAITARNVMLSLAERLERRGARIIKIDTDEIYFAAPSTAATGGAKSRLLRGLRGLIPAGADLRIEGSYPAMFAYDEKNHALLARDGRVLVTGSTLNPRGLERFRRNYLEETLRLLLSGKQQDIPALYEKYRNGLETHAFDIQLLMKKETLQESLADYQMRLKGAKRNPRGVYEIALRSGRDYLKGDQVSYYVTGEGANIDVNEHCRHVSEWDRKRPDENVSYYKARLRELHEKLQPFSVEKA